MTEQRMVDYLLSLSPKLQQAYQVMNDLKFATETRDYSYLLATLQDLKKVRLNKKVSSKYHYIKQRISTYNNAYPLFLNFILT